MVITPGKNFSGQRGFPTPNSLPETSACRTFLVPGDDDWLGLLMGAVSVLREEWAYYQWGTLTPAEAAAAWNDIINKTYVDSFSETCEMIPAPFWDDENGDDTDDEKSPEDQDWYGVWDGETFLEALSYWAVTAFLATGVSEGAAIEFVTPLRTFRLRLKANPHGAKLLVFMDSNIVQLVDLFSASDEVVTVDVISPGSTLMLVHSGEHNPSATPDANGNYTVDIIRSELTVTDVIPANQRYHEETDTVQFSPDGGVTWVDMPSLDPRSSNAFRYPALETSDPRCDAAANMVKWIKDFIDDTTAALGEAAEAFQIANIALGFWTLITGGTSVLLELIVGIGEALTGIGYTALLAAFTSDQYDLLLCIFYCAIDDAGQVSANALLVAESRVTAQLNTTAGIVVNLILQLQGEVGLSNAGVIGGQTGDCADCECSWCYDLTLEETSLGFEAQNVPPWGVEGAWSAGWNAVTLHDVPDNLYQTVMHIYGALPDANYTKVTVNFTISLGELDPDIHFLRLTLNGGGSGSEAVETEDIGTVALTWEGDKTGSGIDIRVEGNCAFGTSAVLSNPGAINFATLHLEGQGVNPFGDDNC